MKRVHIIYMAAGNSRRFGKNKLLTEYNGKELYRHGLDVVLNLLKGSESLNISLSLTVVTQYKEVLAYVNEYAILSPESVDGVSYTIKNGIKYALSKYGECDYFMFMVADQPKISEESILKLISRADSQKILALSYKERRGNPCMFHSSLTPELFELNDDEGGSKLMKKYKPHLVQIENEIELFDIDTAPIK